MKNFKFYSFSLCLLTLLSSGLVSSQEIEKTIYLTGNTSDVRNAQVLSQIVTDAKSSPNPMLFLLGNSTPEEEEYKPFVDQQLKIVKDFGKNAIFMAGEQEWYGKGYKRVQEIEDYIQKNSKAKFYPDNGESIKEHDLGENVVLITVDSQWFLEGWDSQIYINEGSEIQNRTLFFLEFEHQIKKAQGKIVLVAVHHPIETHTKQGLWKNIGGFSTQDFQNTKYRQIRNRLKTIARGVDNVIFLSGHDKNLQYINTAVPQIISGAAGKTESVKKCDSTQFTSAKNGYARLDIDTNGKVVVNFVTIENGASKKAFTTTILKGGNNNSKNDYVGKNQFPATKAASIYTKEAVTKGGFYRSLWGEHYREFYGKDVNAPVATLDTLRGGLKPIKRGGGQQSRSLRLEDKDGKQFVMRALEKSTTQFLQANAFQDVYIGDKLDGTVVDKFLSDFYTTAHPYTPFAVDGLADAVGVGHTNTKLYYIPKQEALGEFNDDFGNELYMIEEHVGDTQVGLKSFGAPKKILSTSDMLQEIKKTGISLVHEPDYIRARLFDMLIGDWDRHEDQWRWGIYEREDGTEYCIPIPRDRDQAFSKYDGSLIKFLTRAIPAIRKLQSYDDNLRSVKWFASSPYPLDLTLIHSSNLDEWQKQAKYIQENLSDEDIEKAFEAIPDEIKGETIEDIKAKLRGRRGNLDQIAKDYYTYLNKFEVINGTQKSDDFIITRMPNGQTNIKILRKDLDILNRTFSHDITKEIWVYGLDGKDSFLVEGEGDDLIKIRIVGGQSHDTYDFKNTKKVKLYDYKSKENTVVNKRSKKWLVDDYELNNYDHKKVKHSFNQLLPLIGFNPDDGVRLGAISNHTFYGLQRNPFTYKHSISASFYTGNSGFDVSYKAEFSNIFHHWNFGVEGLYTSPTFAENFFGFGNETENDRDVNDLDFNRARIRRWNAAVSLNWRGDNGGHFQFKPLVESFNVENTEDRFVANIPINSTVFERQIYTGGEVSYNFRNKDSAAFPTLGLDFGITAGYKTEIGDSDIDNNFGYVQPKLSIDHKLTSSGSLVFATKLNGEIILGDDFEFYHGARIGGVNGLRGFRNERFTGQRSFYQNTDLRLSLGSSRTNVIPIRYGISGSFDYGRVWIDNDDSNIWHTSAGGSFWVVGAESLSANIGYFNSSDGGRVVFVLGFAF